MKLNNQFLAVIIAATAVMAGCTDTQQRTAGGAALGAGAGAIVSGVSGGHVGTGALVGAGVGAAAGYLTSPDPSK